MRRDIELNSLALKTRKMFGVDSFAPVDIFASINGWRDQKITIVYYPLSSRISGMCTRVKDDTVICVNSGTSYGRQRFTLAHELYHILYEENMKRVICDMSMSNDRSDSEREADRFAAYLLIPYDALHQYAENRKRWTIYDVIEAEQFFQISHQAMLMRLFAEEYIDQKQLEEYQKIRVTAEALRMGYGCELYRPSPENKRYFTTGEYIRKVEMLADRELISNGKKEEMLLDAFKPDIVYGSDEEGMCLND